MKRQKSNSTTISPESRLRIEKRCLAYALAAGGAALLAAPASAQVIFTQTNLSLHNGIINIDLNNDGITDVKLKDNCAFCSSSGSIRYLSVLGGQNTAVQVLGRKGGGLFQASAFVAPYGFSIGPNSPKGFVALHSASGAAMAEATCFAGSACRTFGPWRQQKDRFLGFQFSIDGQTHYGWARLSVKSSVANRVASISALLTGYAYETQPNTAILAGDRGPAAHSTAAEPGASDVRPPSLGALSLGSAGLDIWRHRQ